MKVTNCEQKLLRGENKVSNCSRLQASAGLVGFFDFFFLFILIFFVFFLYDGSD